MTSIRSDSQHQLENPSDDEVDLNGFNSDVESSSTCTSRSYKDSQDYWLGKKHWDYLMARTVVSDQAGSGSMEDLDVSEAKIPSVLSHTDTASRNRCCLRSVCEASRILNASNSSRPRKEKTRT